MKAVAAAFNQEKALVGAFSVIVQLCRLIVNSSSHHQALARRCSPPELEDEGARLGAPLVGGGQGGRQAVPGQLRLPTPVPSLQRLGMVSGQ